MNARVKFETRRPTLYLLPFLLIVGAMAFTACSPPAAAPPSRPVFTSAPALVANPNGSTPLAAALKVETNEATTVSLEITDTTDRSLRTVDYATSAAAHEAMPVLGFKFGRAYTVTVKATNAAGATSTSDTTLTFGPVAPPAGFPPIIKHTVDLPTAAPGFILVGLLQSNSNGPAPPTSFLVALDKSGDPVWVWQPTDSPFPLQVERLANGNLMVMLLTTAIVEIDMLGHVVHAWTGKLYNGSHPSLQGVTPVALPVDNFRNFAFINDHIVVMSDARRTVPAYPISETDPTAAMAARDIIENVIVEMDATGSIVNSYSVLDMLGNDPGPVAGPSTMPNPATVGFPLPTSRPPTLPLKIGFDSVDWTVSFYTGCMAVPGPKLCNNDWSHGNALVYIAADDTFVISLRNLDAVIKFRRSDGKLVWIVGDPVGWPAALQPYLLEPQPANGDFWAYHQHSPTFTATGDLLLFDNGNYRASPCLQTPAPGNSCPTTPLPSAKSYSRAVEYAVDLTSDYFGKHRRIYKRWEFIPNVADPVDPANNLFSPVFGKAVELPVANRVRLVHFGRVAKVPGSNPPLQLNGDASVPTKSWIRIMQVGAESVPAVHFDVQIGSSDTTDPVGYMSYRSQYMPYLLPPTL